MRFKQNGCKIGKIYGEKWRKIKANILKNIIKNSKIF